MPPRVANVLDLVKLYDGVKALDGLSFHVTRGEIYGLIGPNGAGKSTTLRIMAGLLKPDSGDVLIEGSSIVKSPEEAKAKLGYLPETPVLPNYLTVNEFLEYVGALRGLSKSDLIKRIRLLLERFDILNLSREFIVSLSKGMKQKLALTACLIHDPQILLLDEPMMALDPKSQRTLKSMLSEKIRAGGSAVVCTHILDVAERLCDRIGILHKGSLIAEGSLSELKANMGSDSSSLEDVFLQLTSEQPEYGQRL